jgi:hypothetical protein
MLSQLIPGSRYHGKPRLADLRRALEAMARHCKEHGVARLAMPRIGCGLDLLQWDEVRAVLEETFRGSDVTVTVYTLGEQQGDIKAFFGRKEGATQQRKRTNSGGAEPEKGEKRKKGSKKLDEKVEVGFDFVTSRPLPEVRPTAIHITVLLPTSGAARREGGAAPRAGGQGEARPLPCGLRRQVGRGAEAAMHCAVQAAGGP